MNILFIGGNFNKEGGSPSGLIDKFINIIKKENVNNFLYYNGGSYEQLNSIIEKVKEFDYVFWWPNVPNELDKIRDVKKINPKVMLISSKRNTEGKYTFQDLLERSFATKSNLCIEFTYENNSSKYHFRVFDLLGNIWADTSNIEECMMKILNRAKFLKSITRESTTQAEENSGCLSWFFNDFKQEMTHVDGNKDFENKDDFILLVKNYANEFAKKMFQTDDVERFLGNASFRCPKGFPSFRYGDYIFVSKRNVNKKYIEKDDFVPVFTDESGKIFYYGENKPSVDTPIQVKLYKELKNINYMVHSHCYIKGASFTKTNVPCGAIEEVNEILSLIDEVYKDRNKTFYAINLKGHGSIMMGNKISDLKDIEIEARNIPEIQ